MLWYLAVVIFLFAPIVAGVVYSFNLGVVNKQTATLTGWTWQWYPAAWNDLSLRRAVRTSLVVASWSAVLSVIVGAALGFVVVRHPSGRMRRFLTALTYLLLMVPESVIGISLLLFYAATRVPLGSVTLVTGITPMAIAVVALVVRARMLTLDRCLEEAAADLGSTRVKTGTGHRGWRCDGVYVLVRQSRRVSLSNDAANYHLAGLPLRQPSIWTFAGRLCGCFCRFRFHSAHADSRRAALSRNAAKRLRGDCRIKVDTYPYPIPVFSSGPSGCVAVVPGAVNVYRSDFRQWCEALNQ